MASQVSVVIKSTGGSAVVSEIKAIGDEGEKAGGRLGGLHGALGGIAQVAGGFVIGKALTELPGLIGNSTKAASDSAESLSKAQTIFKDGFGEIDKFAQGAADSVGLSKSSAYEATATFGNLFVQLGVGKEAAAGMSTKLVGLASDFASFHNADISEVIEAQTAAFRGEYDSLQKFVPSINAAKVEQEALAMTGKKTTKDLTDQDKALAVNALMFKGAGDAVGDFARTKDGDANKTRILQAKYEDLNATIGGKLLPIQIKIKQALLDAIPPAVKFGEALSDKIGPYVTLVADVVSQKLLPPLIQLAQWFAGNEQAIAVAGIAIGTVLVAAFAAWALSAGAAAVATIAAAAPVIAVVAAVALLAAGVYLLVKNWDAIVEKYPIVGQAADTLKASFQTFVDFITGPFKDGVIAVYTVVSEWVGKAIAFVVDHWDEIKAPFVAFGTWVKETYVPFWVAVYTAVAEEVGKAIAYVVDHWDGIKAPFVAFGSWVMNTYVPFWVMVYSTVAEQVKKAVDFVVEHWDEIKGPFVAFGSWIADTYIPFWVLVYSTVYDNVKKAIDYVVEHWDEIQNKIAAFGTWFKTTFVDPWVKNVQTVIDAVKTLIEWVDKIPHPSLNNGGQGVGKQDPNASARADGGPVSAGALYLVGERGPEFFIPGASGRIASNAESRQMAGSGGGGITINIDTVNAATPAAASQAAGNIGFALAARGWARV